jgi:hypothetical protein
LTLPLRYRSIPLFLIASLLLLPRTITHAEQWKILDTKYSALYYLDIEDLKAFDRKIDFHSNPDSFSNYTSDSSGPEPGFKIKLASKVDALFERVQLILDMRKPLKTKIKVKIYPNKALLHDAYFRIYKRKKQVRAWYIFKHNTIYVNARDIFSGMLAHEIAHGIIDNFLTIKPPMATAEILARYVDKHLHKKSNNPLITPP